MAKLQFQSINDANGSPQDLLQFAHELKVAYDARPMQHQPVHDFLEKEVTFGGKSVPRTKLLMDLEQRDWDMDEFDAKDMSRLVQADKIFKSMDKSWDITKWMPDQRISVALEQLQAMESTNDLAARSMSMLGAKPAEHTVKSALRM